MFFITLDFEFSNSNKYIYLAIPYDYHIQWLLTEVSARLANSLSSTIIACMENLKKMYTHTNTHPHTNFNCPFSYLCLPFSILMRELFLRTCDFKRLLNFLNILAYKSREIHKYICKINDPSIHSMIIMTLLNYRSYIIISKVFRNVMIQIFIIVSNVSYRLPAL